MKTIANEIVRLIQKPIWTSKSYRLCEEKQLVFNIDSKATKLMIKEAVELIFSVKVDNVNTYYLPKKVSRLKRGLNKYKKQKRAIIKLKPDQELFLIPTSLKA
uniref:Ribosomal protein L23 n=1 Tax=Gloeochaete wittrockiana TaxID=38269 RepID=A0A3G1IVY8_9EUKA|nr:ribosomal protein L23 [Gloeochaete wittrockiana]ASQ40215.1 ribosomal protein L23 [Gloeochaete wittrockiana]